MLTLKEIKIEDITDWNKLVEESSTATFFQRKEWLQAWLQYWGKNGLVKIYAIYSGDQLVGIAPLQITSDKIMILGVPDPSVPGALSDFGDLVIKTTFEKDVWGKVLTHLKLTYPNLTIELNYIREESPSFLQLTERGGIGKEMDVSPVIYLPKTWEDYLAMLNRHDRHEIRRKMRKIEEEDIKIICDEINPQNINDFYRLMIASNEEKNNFLSADMKSFFTKVITELGCDKLLTLCFLKYNNVNIAGILLLFQPDESLLYNAGYDPKYSYLSPGLILNMYVIKQAIEQGKKKFDFLRGNEKYKYDLGGVERKLFKFSF